MKQVYYKIYFIFFIKTFYIEMYKKIPTRISTKLYNEIKEKLPIGGDGIHAQICDQLKLNI